MFRSPNCTEGCSPWYTRLLGSTWVDMEHLAACDLRDALVPMQGTGDRGQGRGDRESEVVRRLQRASESFRELQRASETFRELQRAPESFQRASGSSKELQVASESIREHLERIS